MCTAPCLHRSASLEGMGRVKFRTLKGLYRGTQPLSLPTQIQMEEKSRKCNLHATRCSSCMHFEQVAAIVGVGTGDFTNEASKEKKTSQCSSNDGILFSPSLSSSCNCRQHTSSEASNIFSVSSSHDPFSANAESQATVRDFDGCEDIDLPLNKKKAQAAGESGDSPKALIKFDNEGFSNQHKELDILDDNVSCISKSDSTNLTIASLHIDKADNNHHGVQNVTQKLPLEGVVHPNRSDQSEFSSLKDFFDCTISPKGEPFECSGEQVESSPARVATSGFSGQIDGVFNYPTFMRADPHLNCEDPAVETESHLYCKKHLQNSLGVIDNTSIQGQSPPVGPRVMSDLIEDEVRVCDICGDAGQEELLAICSKCTDGAEHIYCGRIKLDKVPQGDWTCEECILRTDTEKPVQDKVEEAARISKGRSGTNYVNSTFQLLAKRCAGPLKAQSAKKARAIGMSAVLPKSPKPCNNSLLHRDSSCNNLKKGKMKAAKEITSVLQLSGNSKEKEKVPSACADNRHMGALKAELYRKRRDLETRVISPKASNTSNHSLFSREPPLKNLEKMNIEADHCVSSVKQSSYVTEEKAELPTILVDTSPKLCSLTDIFQDKCSLLKSRSSNPADLKLKGQQANGSLLKSVSSNAADLMLKGRLPKGGSLQKQKVARNPDFHDNKKREHPRMVSKSLSFNSVSSDKLNATHLEALKKLSHAKETRTVKGKNMPELHNPAMCSPASDLGVITVESEKEAMSCGETFFTGSNCHKLDSVQSCGQFNESLKPRSHITHKPASDEGSYQRNLPQFEAAIFSQGFVIPKPDYIWLGKFQMHNSEGVASSCDGIQAHLSTFASPKVLEVVDRLPEIIMLEELPRLRTWPSQFIERQATEENIALYFFAKDLDSYRTYYRRLLECMTKNDLALKGNLDGVELLIFPSKLLPEKSQLWNKLLFLWGVFRGRKVNGSINTPLSNSGKEKNRDSEKRWALDLNAYPQDGQDTAGVDEGGKCWSVNGSLGRIPKFDSTGKRSLGDEILLEGDGYSSAFTDPAQALDKEGENKSQVVNLDLSLWPKSATPNGELWVSSAIADNRTNEEVQGKPVMDVGEKASGWLSLSLASPLSCEQNLGTEKEIKQLVLKWQDGDTLVSLSKT